MFDTIRETIREAVAGGMPSMAVSVARDGEVIWEEAFGWADKERGIPATPDTMYYLASVSKTFAGTSGMILKERGLIALDRPANDFLGAGRFTATIGAERDITIRRIANHTAGFSTYLNFFDVTLPERPRSREETIARYGVTCWPPGERYCYSNMGYLTLEHLAELHSGMSYGEFLRREIFDPLGMRYAALEVPAEYETHAAQRYRATGEPYAFVTSDHLAAGSIFCGARDLMRYGLFHLKRRLPDQSAILSDTALDEMHEPTARTDHFVDGKYYGFGMLIWDDRHGYRIIGHTGGSFGSNTIFWLIPSEGIAVIVLTNVDDPALDVYKVAEDIIASMLPDYAAGIAAERAAKMAESDHRVPAEFVGSWAGTIRTPDGERRLTLRIDDPDTASGRLGDGPETEITDLWHSDGLFYGRMAGDLDTVDTARTPHVLTIEVIRRDNRLVGAVSAKTIGRTPNGHRNIGFTLPHYAELHEVES